MHAYVHGYTDNDQNAALRLENKLLHERIADLERERNKLIQGIRKLLETIDRELGVKE